MKNVLTRLVLVSASLGLVVTMIHCGKDPAPVVCQPRSLQYESDSVTYTYADGKVQTVSYFVSGRQTNQDDLGYNSDGQLISVGKSEIAIDGDFRSVSHHTIEYNDGRPSLLTTDSFDGHFSTEFIHNSHGQLETAETTSGFQKTFVGTTRYEYDANGNIPKVYYLMYLNGLLTERLARENLSFDDREKFYRDTPELKVLNEYVYGYLPNKNNCLSSTVHYYNYRFHFSSPLSITFVATYDDEGQIKSLQSEGPNTRLYSGEVLFKNILYDCH